LPILAGSCTHAFYRGALKTSQQHNLSPLFFPQRIRCTFAVTI
jgi:hypothetical protein